MTPQAHTIVGSRDKAALIIQALSDFRTSPRTAEPRVRSRGTASASGFLLKASPPIRRTETLPRRPVNGRRRSRHDPVRIGDQRLVFVLAWKNVAGGALPSNSVSKDLRSGSTFSTDRSVRYTSPPLCMAAMITGAGRLRPYCR